MIDAARAHGVQQVVFLSVLGAQHLPVLPHRQIERHLEQSGLDWVFLRASYFMQNLTGVHRDDIRLRDELYLPAGRGRTRVTDVPLVTGILMVWTIITSLPLQATGRLSSNQDTNCGSLPGW